MIKKDEVYVLEQPKKIINAVVIVTNLFPLDKKIHDGLNELKKIADITFIFNSYHFPNTNNVDKRKFSQLYGASSFVDSKDNLGISLFKYLDYDINIFKNHISFLVTTTEDEVTKESCNKIIEISGSSILKPVFKIRRLNTEEFFNYYWSEKDEIKVNNNNLFNTIISWIKKFKYNNDKLDINEDAKESLYDSYCTHSSESKILYLRSSSTVRILVEYFNNSDKIKEVIESFKYTSNIKCIISSIIKYLEINNLDIDIDNLEINKLYEK